MPGKSQMRLKRGIVGTLVTKSMKPHDVLLRCYHALTMEQMGCPMTDSPDRPSTLVLEQVNATRRLELPARGLGRHPYGVGAACGIRKGLTLVWLGNEDSNLG
jgi:hypothetical protein